MATQGKWSLGLITLGLCALVVVGGCKRNTAEYGGKTEKPTGVPTPAEKLDPNVPAVPSEAASTGASY